MNRTLKTLVAAALSFSLVFQQSGFAQGAPQLPLPAYLNSIALPADTFRPVLCRGLSVDEQGKPNFLLVPGNGKPLNSAQLSSEQRLFSDYFSIGLSLPDSSFWVNLRPDSPDKVIDPLLAQTDLGKVLLEADLQLKKDLAALTDPSTAEGNRYWTRLYQKAEQLFPNENAEIPTYNRPWIVPGEVIIKENGNGVLIYKAALKVMLEQDHLKEGDTLIYAAGGDPRFAQLNDYSSRLIRERILPRLTVIVNSSKRYAQLRQAYNALILAQWFKSRIRQNRGSEAIAQLGFESGKTDNLRSAVAWHPKTYFDQYAASFSKGEYSKEEAVSSPSGITVRRYFSGGINFDGGAVSSVKRLAATAFSGYLSALMFSGSVHALYSGDMPTAALAAAAGLAAGAATHSIYKNMGRDGGIIKVRQTAMLRISLKDVDIQKLQRMMEGSMQYLEWINASPDAFTALSRVLSLLVLDIEMGKDDFDFELFVHCLPELWEVMDKNDDALIKIALNPRSDQQVEAMIMLASKGDAKTLMKLRKARVNKAIRNDLTMSAVTEAAINHISDKIAGQNKDGGVPARLSKHERLVHSLAVLIERLDKEVGKDTAAAPKRIEQILWQMQKYLVRIEPQAEAFLADDHVDNILPGDVIYFKSKAGAHQGICIECRGDALTYLRIDYPPIPIELGISLVSDESMHEISNLRIIRVYRQDQGRDGGEDDVQKHLRNLAMDEQIRRGAIENIDMMNAVLSSRLQQAYAQKAAPEEIDTLVKQLSENVLKGAAVRKQSDAFMQSLLKDIADGDPLRTQFALEQFDRKLRASQRFPRRLQHAYWDTLALRLYALVFQQPVKGEDYRLARARQDGLAMLVRLGSLKRELPVAGEVIEAALAHPDFTVRMEAAQLQKRIEADKDGGEKIVDPRVASLRAVLDQLKPYLLDHGQPVFGEPEMTRLLWELQSCFAALKPAALPVEMDYGPREVRSGDILYITEKPGDAPREAVCLASRDFEIDYMRFDFPPVPIDIRAEVVIGKPLLDFHRIDVFSIRDGGDARINEQIADALISFMESMRGSSREQIEQGLKPLLAGYLALVHRGIEPVIMEEIESDPIATSLDLNLGSRWDEYDALVRDIAKVRFSLPTMQESFLVQEQGNASYKRLAAVAAVFLAVAGLGMGTVGHMDYSYDEHMLILGDAQPPEDMAFMLEHGLQSDRLTVMRQVTDDALSGNLKHGSLFFLSNKDSFDPVSQEIALRDDLLEVSLDGSEPAEVRVEAVRQLGRMYGYLYIQTEAFIDEYENLVNTTNADIDTDAFRVFYEPIYDTLQDLAENDADPAVRDQAQKELDLIIASGRLSGNYRDGGEAPALLDAHTVAALRDDDNAFERFYSLARQNRWIRVSMPKPKVRTCIKDIVAAMEKNRLEVIDSRYLYKSVNGVNLFRGRVYHIDTASALFSYADYLNTKDGGSGQGVKAALLRRLNVPAQQVYDQVEQYLGSKDAFILEALVEEAEGMGIFIRDAQELADWYEHLERSVQLADAAQDRVRLQESIRQMYISVVPLPDHAAILKRYSDLAGDAAASAESLKAAESRLSRMLKEVDYFEQQMVIMSVLKQVRDRMDKDGGSAEARRGAEPMSDGGKKDLSTARPGLAVNNPGGVDFRSVLYGAQVNLANTPAITAGMISQIAAQASFQVKDLKAVQKQLLSRISGAQTAQELPVQELKACLAVCSHSGAETAGTAKQIALCLMNILAEEEARGLESSVQVQELLEFAEACQA